MREALLAHETDFAGWRAAARRLWRDDVPPREVRWTVTGDSGDLFAPEADEGAPAPFAAPRAFVQLASDIVLHRDPRRFDLLYRLLWRLRDEPGLMAMAGDADVAAAGLLARGVWRASHKMKAFVRFRQVEGADEETYVAWFEPAHRVVARTAPFFAERFANQRFSILTPEVSAHWDRRTLSFGPGADRAGAPSDDALEDFWRTYYASIFNPARLKPAAMQREMPKRYWRNLPEARLIPELIEAAEARTAAMVARAPTTPRAAPVRTAPLPPPAGTTDEIAAGVGACRRCDLWRDATQAVAAEGPSEARLMLVGEQPGDREDLAGRPFVGPAGQLLDRALSQAGVPRGEVFVTNAVKHFKHELRGKRRIHKSPNAGEVETCRWWLEAERAAVRPRVILALGATAALAVMGRPTPVSASRGRPLPLTDGAYAVVSYHPSYLLRLPDERAKAAAFDALVGDLGLAWRLAAEPMAASA
jgi:probable DNA metabolism protein